MHAFDVILKLKVDLLQPFAQDVASVLLQFVCQNGIPKGLTALISSASRRIGASACVTRWWGQRSFRDVSRLALGLRKSCKVREWDATYGAVATARAETVLKKLPKHCFQCFKIACSCRSLPFDYFRGLNDRQWLSQMEDVWSCC